MITSQTLAKLGSAPVGALELFDIDSISALRAIITGSTTAGADSARPAIEDGSIANVTGYAARNDGGGGTFIFAAFSSAADDGGSVIAPTNGLGRWIRQTNTGGSVSVKTFGAKGDGVTDDTAAITAAWNYCKTLTGAVLAGDIEKMSVSKLRFPAGDYIFNGPALDAAAGLAISVEGEGNQHSRIVLAAGIYLFNITGTAYTFALRNLHIYGGKGCWKFSNAGVNVQGEYVFEDNIFAAYTEAAIVSLSVDMPYFKINRNVFYGTTASKGVALASDNDQSEIANNTFLRNLYHLKLGAGGNAVNVRANDFIRFTNGGGAPQLTDVWIVPRNIAVNAGQGCNFTDNKFGNENISATDYKFLVADEAAGVDFADKNHAVTLSAGYWNGFALLDNKISMGGNNTTGLVYSYTPNVYNFLIENMWIDSVPKIINFDALVLFTTDERHKDLNVIRLNRLYDGSENYYPALLGRKGMAIIDDPFGFQQGNIDSITKFGAGFDPGYTDFGNLIDSSNPLLVNATKAALVDALGGNNAAELSYTANGGYGYYNVPVTNVIIGRRAWVEVDIKAGSANPVGSVRVNLIGANGIALKRTVTVPANWTTLRFPFAMQQTGAAPALRFESVDYSAGVREKLKVGRVRVYHANEPQNLATFVKESKVAYDPPSLGDGVGATTTVTVVGAALGDFAQASFSLDTQGITITAWVSAADTVSVRFQNESGGILDIGAGVLRARVAKPTI